MASGATGLLGAMAFAAAVLLGAGGPSWADGALAVGSTGDVVKDGIAFGMVVDEPKDTAAETAVRRCRTFKARAAAERCKIVATFSGECFAVAYDPKPGTPGAGWGIGPDQLTANRHAIAMCEATAGPSRKGFCQVESAGCDTTPQAATKTPAQDAAKTAPQETAKAAPRETDPQWIELRKALSKQEQSQFDLSWPVLLLIAGGVVGLAYVLSRFLKDKNKTNPSVDKPS